MNSLHDIPIYPHMVPGSAEDQRINSTTTGESIGEDVLFWGFLKKIPKSWKKIRWGFFMLFFMLFFESGNEIPRKSSWMSYRVTHSSTLHFGVVHRHQTSISAGVFPFLCVSQQMSIPAWGFHILRNPLYPCLQDKLWYPLTLSLVTHLLVDFTKQWVQGFVHVAPGKGVGLMQSPWVPLDSRRWRFDQFLWFKSRPKSTVLYLVGGFNPPEKYESQIGSPSQLLGKIKNV